MKNILFWGACVLCFSTASHADWQYTKWGMSPAQVISASKSNMKKLSSKEIANKHIRNTMTETLVGGIYKSGQYVFEASFAFDQPENKLSMVYLKLLDHQQGGPLIKSLTEKYGKPQSIKYNEILKFTSTTWATKADIITINDLVHYTLIYKPATNKDNEGL